MDLCLVNQTQKKISASTGLLAGNGARKHATPEWHMSVRRADVTVSHLRFKYHSIFCLHKYSMSYPLIK